MMPASVQHARRFFATMDCCSATGTSGCGCFAPGRGLCLTKVAAGQVVKERVLKRYRHPSLEASLSKRRLNQVANFPCVDLLSGPA